MKTSFIHSHLRGESNSKSAHKRLASHQMVLGLALMAMVAVLSACLPQPLTTTEDSADIFTQAAETFSAQLTQEVAATAIAQLTELARQPSELPPTALPTQPQQATATAIPTHTPLPPSPLPPTSTPTTVPCDQAQLVGDMNVPPDSILPTGARFNKIWRVLNTGTCTWTPDYALVYVGGDRMGNITVFSLSHAVDPGETVNLEAMLTVPGYTGNYQSDWMLRNPSGITFGIQPDGVTPLQARIYAIQSPSLPEGALDFAAEYCTATWQSASARLSCPGISQDDLGAVILLNQPNIESGSTRKYALWTRPDRNINGWINGVYPVYIVREYDHFQATVGCLEESQGCEVVFLLRFEETDGTSTELGRWREIYDGQTTKIDVDLTVMMGKRGNFVLGVSNAGNPDAANAIWLAPRIKNLEPSTTLALTWEREGKQEDSCDKMQIILSGLVKAEARANYCAGGDDYFVTGPLTVDELAQLLDWMQRLGKFGAEVFQASPVQPVISWIEFNGLGSETAHNDDIQAINRYAAQLFNRLTSKP